MDIKTGQKQLTDAVQVLQTAKDKVARLIGKQEALATEIKGFPDQLAQAKQSKRKAMDAYLLDESLESQLNHARQIYDDLLSKSRGAEEMMTAYDRYISDLQSQLPKLTENVDIAKRSLARAVFDQKVTEIRSKVLNDVLDTHAAGGFCMVGSFESFLQQVFGPFRMEDNQKRRAVFEDKYFNTGTLKS